jgi:hypothetical protein
MLAEAASTKPSAASARALNAILASATESVNSLLVRPLGLYPTVTTYTFDWPPEPRSRGYRLWLEERTLISLTAATSGGAALDVADLRPYPLAGPPYHAIETNRGGNTIFGGGATPQGDISITGVWGYRNDETTPGVLTASVDAITDAIPVDGEAAAEIGVGDLLRLGTERVIVESRSWSTTGETVAVGGLVAQNSARSVTVVDSSAFGAGETILIGEERMRVTDIVGSRLIVERAAYGSVLQAHTAGDTIYASRLLLVRRGALGTTAAAHLAGDDVVMWVPPPLARELCLAEALNTGQQRLAAYARVAGTGDAQREAVGRGLKDIRTDARRQLGRRSRVTAV